MATKTLHEFLWEDAQREADADEEAWALRNLKRRLTDGSEPKEENNDGA